MNEQNFDPPHSWEDEETIAADFRLWFQDQYFEHPDMIQDAFRIGWKAGARQATMDMWRWIHIILFGREEQEINEEDKQ